MHILSKYITHTYKNGSISKKSISTFLEYLIPELY